MTTDSKPTLDPAQLKVGSFIKYDMTRFGIVIDPSIKIQILDEQDRAHYVDGVRVQLWWTSASGKSFPLRGKDGDAVPLSRIEELLGERALPAPIEEPETKRLAPNRRQGYKDCDRSGCPKPIYGIVHTQAMRQTYTGFKFGDIEPKTAVLVALCSVHWKSRDDYGITGQTWFDWPKPEKPLDMAEPQKQAETPKEQKKRTDSNSEPPRPVVEASKTRKDGKPDGRQSRWTKMTPEQRQDLVERIRAGRRKQKAS